MIRQLKRLLSLLQTRVRAVITSCNEESCKQPDFDEKDGRSMKHADQLELDQLACSMQLAPTAECLTCREGGEAKAGGNDRYDEGLPKEINWELSA